jgi:mannitol/fructose-specific phosphotransferase system IIA component (Ntr-type)
VKRFSSPGKIISLADFTGEDVMVPQLRARDMAGAILEMCETFQRSDARWEAQKLFRLALEREHQMTTAMGFGAAFPHVRSNACPRLHFGLGRAVEPIEWGPPGSIKVNFVFLNAVPANDADWP